MVWSITESGGGSLAGLVREGQEVIHELCLNNEELSYGDLMPEASPCPCWILDQSC